MVRTKLKRKNYSKKSPKCHRFLRCKHCQRIKNKTTQQIRNTSTGRKYKIPQYVDCNSKNLIYCIECSSCHLQYVGQTKNKFVVRINQHKNGIKHNRDTPVAHHFNTHKCHLDLYILQNVIGRSKQKERNLFENYWISRLHSTSPEGMNILDWGELHSKTGCPPQQPEIFQNPEQILLGHATFDSPRWLEYT